jgi:hypothetical protein
VAGELEHANLVGLTRNKMCSERKSSGNPTMNFVKIYRQWMVRKIDYMVTGGKAEAGQDS